MQLVARILSLAQRLPTREIAVIGIWLLALTALELAGRHSTGDVTDLLGLLALGTLLSLTYRMHRQQPLQVIERLSRAVLRIARRVSSRRVEFGVDLRGTPQVDVKWPVLPCATIAALVLGLICVLLLSPYLPSSAREFLRGRAYTVYLLLLGALWSGLVLSTAVMCFLVWARIHDYCVNGFTGQGLRSVRGELLAVAAVCSVLLAGVLLPPWVPLVTCAVLFALLTLAIVFSGRGLRLLWKERAAPQIYGLDGRWLLWSQWAVIFLFTTICVVAARGELFYLSVEPFNPVMPLTWALGAILSWTAVAGLASALISSLRFLLLAVWFHPGRMLPVSLHVTGAGTRAERRQIREQLAERGWRVRFAPARARATDVCIHLASEDARARRGALRCTLESFSDSNVLDRIQRRDEIQNRRLLIRGLQRLFKRSARLRGRRGTGFWIGLQHWFILGLARDVDADYTADRETTVLDEIIGPPYYRVFPARTRQHFHRITQALDIDLIFVEDGVTFKRLVRVLRIMFEIYDMHGGKRRAEELHFTGLPGVRVILHELTLGGSNPFEQSDYPEPDYQEIGRARILHVFRDRGEEEEPWSAPSSWEDIPVVGGVR